MSRNAPQTHKLWSDLISSSSFKKYCQKNHIAIESAVYSEDKKIQKKIRDCSAQHLGVINDWNTCSSFIIFGLAILHMNLNGLRVILRNIIVNSLRIYKRCEENPSLATFFFPENQNQNETANHTLYSEKFIFDHLVKCLNQSYSYFSASEHLVLKTHGNTTRFQYSHILRFIECEKCGFKPYHNSPMEKMIRILLLTWLQIIRPWNICIQTDFNIFIQKYLLDSKAYQIYLEHFKSIYIHIWGPSNYTRYFLALTDSGPFFLKLAYRLKTTAAEICGEHVVEALNNSVN